ncbi:hypothetical protein C8F01DRAFT_1258312 [Mycena amicta]|nr:hypothetical protein C8F01DRAFT_1258312 [Mycena amicta]
MWLCRSSSTAASESFGRREAWDVRRLPIQTRPPFSWVTTRGRSFQLPCPNLLQASPRLWSSSKLAYASRRRLRFLGLFRRPCRYYDLSATMVLPDILALCHLARNPDRRALQDSGSLNVGVHIRSVVGLSCEGGSEEWSARSGAPNPSLLHSLVRPLISTP